MKQVKVLKGLFGAAAILVLVLVSCQGITVETETVDPPSFDTLAGPYAINQTVHIQHTDPAVTIWYSVNGAAWSSATPGVAIPVNFGESTIAAYASKAGLRQSATIQSRFAVVWESLPALPVAQTQLASAVLGGKIYLFEDDFVQIYDPVNKSYDDKKVDFNGDADYLQSRNGMATGALGSILYRFGGSVGTVAQSTSCKYSGSDWTAATALLANLSFGALVNHENALYLLGGTSAIANPIVGGANNTIYSFDGTSWVDAGEELLERLCFISGASTGVSGSIYIAGGIAETGVKTTKVHRYLPSSNLIEVAANLPEATDGIGMASMNNVAYLFGGANSAEVAKNWVFSITEGSSTLEAKTSMPLSLTGVSAIAYGDYIYLFGGYNGGYSASALRYAPLLDHP